MHQETVNIPRMRWEDLSEWSGLKLRKSWILINLDGLHVVASHCYPNTGTIVTVVRCLAHFNAIHICHLF